MTSTERDATVRAELAKARRTLEAARALHAAGFHDDAVSRAYYAAVTAVEVDGAGVTVGVEAIGTSPECVAGDSG